MFEEIVLLMVIIFGVVPLVGWSFTFGASYNECMVVGAVIIIPLLLVVSCASVTVISVNHIVLDGPTIAEVITITFN